MNKKHKIFQNSLKNTVSYISKVHFLKARIIAFFTNYLAVNNLLFKN